MVTRTIQKIYFEKYLLVFVAIAMRELAQSHLTCAVTARIISELILIRCPIYRSTMRTFYFLGLRYPLFNIEGSWPEAHPETEFTI